MRPLLTVFVLCVASQCTAAIVGVYESSVPMLTRDRVTADSMFELELASTSANGGQVYFNSTMPFSQLPGHSFEIPAPSFLTDGNLDFVSFRLAPVAGALDGFLNFAEDTIEYAYTPHTSIDFFDEVDMELVRITVLSIAATPLGEQDVVGALVRLEFDGAMHSAVPEPAAIVLLAVGMLLWIWTYKKIGERDA